MKQAVFAIRADGTVVPFKTIYEMPNDTVVIVRLRVSQLGGAIFYVYSLARLNEPIARIHESDGFRMHFRYPQPVLRGLLDLIEEYKRG